MFTRESPSQTRLLASGLLVLTFVVGGLAGAATDRAVSSTESRPPPVHRSDDNRENRHNTRRQPSVFFSPGVFDSIGATPQQRQAIEAVLDRRDREANRLFLQIKPSLDSIRKQTWGEMKAQLTPEQLAKLDRIIQERRERWRKDRQHNQADKPRP